MKLKLQLLTVADAFRGATGRSESDVSKNALGRASALKSIRGGKDMLSGNVEAGLQWLSDHWPEDAPWPRQVPRPVPASPGDTSEPDASAAG